MSFYGYMVNRDENPAVVFEAVFNNEYVQGEVEDAQAEGFDITTSDAKGCIQIVFVTHDDGRPWIYREFYPVVEDEPTVGPKR